MYWMLNESSISYTCPPRAGVANAHSQSVVPSGPGVTHIGSLTPVRLQSHMLGHDFSSQTRLQASTDLKGLSSLATVARCPEGKITITVKP